MTAERAYAEVERITRQRARNFAYGIMVLPREKRRAIAAIARRFSRGSTMIPYAKLRARRRVRRSTSAYARSAVTVRTRPARAAPAMAADAA